MDRIEHPTAVETRPTHTVPAGSKKGYAVAFDPITGTPATENLPEQYNAIQETLMAVIEDAGLQGDHKDDKLLLKAVKSLGGVPVGMELLTMRTHPISGWLFEEGQILSRETYPNLWNWANEQGLVISESNWSTNYGMYSDGDGSTTFRLPDTRGQFIRLQDNGAGIDPDALTRIGGDKTGSIQQDELKSHRHSIPTNAGGAGHWNLRRDTGGSNGNYNSNYAGGSETRPKNMYRKLMVKY